MTNLEKQPPATGLFLELAPAEVVEAVLCRELVLGRHTPKTLAPYADHAWALVAEMLPNGNVGCLRLTSFPATIDVEATVVPAGEPHTGGPLPEPSPSEENLHTLEAAAASKSGKGRAGRQPRRATYTSPH